MKLFEPSPSNEKQRKKLVSNFNQADLAIPITTLPYEPKRFPNSIRATHTHTHTKNGTKQLGTAKLGNDPREDRPDSLRLFFFVFVQFWLEIENWTGKLEAGGIIIGTLEEGGKKLGNKG